MPGFTANLRTVLAVSLLSACAGCEYKVTGGGHSSTGGTAGTAGSRNVNFEVDSSAQVTNETGATVVTFEGHSIRVEKDRLLLDGKEAVKFEPTVKNVDFKVVGGTLTVKADSVQILATQISK